MLMFIGYEALIGMLKWAMPIDPERTLSVLLSTLYSKVCLDKVTQL